VQFPTDSDERLLTDPFSLLTATARHGVPVASPGRPKEHVMARTSITFTALAATLALALSPVAASAHDRDDHRDDRRDDRRGYQDDHRRHGHDRRDDRRYAQRYDQRYDQRHDQRGYAYAGDYRQQGYNGNYAPQRDYYAGNAYPAQRGYYADTNYQRGYGNRCRGNGSTGTIIGAIAGGLIGNSVAGRGDRTLGTVLGGGVGAVAGRAIDRADDRC
jgi:hypothetical protein